MESDLKRVRAVVDSGVSEATTQEISRLTEEKKEIATEVKKINEEKNAINKLREYEFPWNGLFKMKGDEIRDAAEKYILSERTMNQKLTNREKEGNREGNGKSRKRSRANIKGMER